MQINVSIMEARYCRYLYREEEMLKQEAATQENNDKAHSGQNKNSE